MENVYDGFTECYLDLARQIYNDYDYISKPRNQTVKEKLGMKFTILNPRKRIPHVKSRKFSMHYMIAELLWYISGSNSTEWISNYSSFWKHISDDGTTANSAYGSRIFKKHDRISNKEFVQWDYIIKELKDDPDSRRAVIHIRSPADSIHAKLDVPCTLSLQFFIRNGKLHQVVSMRSSDLILGIAYDIPAFTFLQEMLALELDVGLGTYTHISNSLHIYEKHFEMVEEILKESVTDEIQFPAIPFRPPVGLLWNYEKEIKKASDIVSIKKLIRQFADHFDTEYWLDWIKILASHRLKKLGFKQEAKELQDTTSFVGYHRR